MVDDMTRHRSIIDSSPLDDMVSDIGHDMPNDLLQLVAGG
jgi:hypothetical protein